MSFGSLFQEVGNGYTELKNLLTYCSSSLLLSSTYPNMHKTFLLCPHADPQFYPNYHIHALPGQYDALVYQQTEFPFNLPSQKTQVISINLNPVPSWFSTHLFLVPMSQNTLMCVLLEKSLVLNQGASRTRVPCNMCCSLQARCGQAQSMTLMDGFKLYYTDKL